jgi:uncharacterized membrane protein
VRVGASRSRLPLAVTTIAAGLFVLTLVLVPVAEIKGLSEASWLRLGLSPICHQIGDRCLDLGAGPLPVCARCAGLYTGGLTGLLATLVGHRRFRPRLRWLLLAAAPSAIDFALGLFDLPDLANWPRFAVATVPGFVLGLLLADAVSASTATDAEATADGGIT